MPDVELRISILNVEYVFRGFNAISDLNEFCVKRCSDSRDANGGCEYDPVPTPEPQAMLRGNGEGDPAPTAARSEP